MKFPIKHMNIDPFTDGIMPYCTTVGLADSENDRVVSMQTYDGFKQHKSPPVSFIYCTLRSLSHQTAWKGEKMTLILKSSTEVLQLSSARAGHP